VRDIRPLKKILENPTPEFRCGIFDREKSFWKIPHLNLGEGFLTVNKAYVKSLTQI
jgi:hypothetical protein